MGWLGLDLRTHLCYEHCSEMLIIGSILRLQTNSWIFSNRKQDVFIISLFPVKKDNFEFAVAACVIPIVPGYHWKECGAVCGVGFLVVIN